ncbi:MAG: hypothetical protein ACJ8GN_31280 [Longimicrobiaceae bacterium]
MLPRTLRSGILPRCFILLICTSLPGCGGDGGGPGTGPAPLRVVTIEPEHFAAGDTVVIGGTGLGSATVFIDGAEVVPVDRGETRLRFVTPASLPVCASPLPTVTLAVRAGGAEVSRTLSVRGVARPVSLGAGEHVVLAQGAGCPVRLAAGTYGVALYTVAPPSYDGLRYDRRPYTLVVQPAGGAAPAVVAGPRPSAALFPHARDYGAPPPRPAAARDAAACTRAPAPTGSVVRVQNATQSSIAATEEASDFRVVSASTHFAVLMRDAELAAFSPADQARAAASAGVLEAEVYAFLADNLGPLPDYDGDGRLTVVVTALPGLSGTAPPFAYYGDGCRGDLIWLSDQMIRRPEAPYFGWQTITVHEATHWIDFANEGFIGKPDWSVEGLATLMQHLWLERKHGVDFWAEHDDGSTCWYHCTITRRLVDEHYGPIDGYINGPTILRYLVQESVPPGTPYAGPLHVLLRRIVNTPRIQPLFELLGGRGRTEAELQGELLLMLYADGYVAGASPRVQHHTFDLPKLPRAEIDVQKGIYPFPMRSFTVDATSATRRAIPLALPDGIVFELAVPAGGASLDVTGPDPTAWLAIVRAR